MNMIDVIVKRKQVEADGIVSFELERQDGSALPPFSAGSHIDVHAPGGFVLQYSLCNHATQEHSYLIAVLRDPASRGGSIAMHDLVHEGDVIAISEPRNLFALAANASRSLLLAGGIGITPLLCMAERLAHAGAEFDLHYCGRAQSRMAFVERMQSSVFADRVTLHCDDGDAGQRFDAATLLARPDPGTHLYVCGPTGFMDAVLAAAAAAGWSPDRLHREYFAAPVKDVAQQDAGFDIKIASTGAIYAVPANQRVSDVLKQNGIHIPIGCQEGLCGTCITRLLEGEADHRDVCLSDAERAVNDQFTPCCSRAKSPLLVLDI
jgi:vanillate O-demethylase ferredoxin subunit